MIDGRQLELVARAFDAVVDGEIDFALGLLEEALIPDAAPEVLPVVLFAEAGRLVLEVVA